MVVVIDTAPLYYYSCSLAREDWWVSAHQTPGIPRVRRPFAVVATVIPIARPLARVLDGPRTLRWKVLSILWATFMVRWACGIP